MVEDEIEENNTQVVDQVAREEEQSPEEEAPQEEEGREAHEEPI